MTTLSLDFETRSVVDLKKSGVHVYAEHPSTDILCMAWAFDAARTQLWHPGLPFPAEVEQSIEDGVELRAFNAQFERTMWQVLLRRGYTRVLPFVQQWHCTAAEAAAMALPRALGQCADALGVAVRKDKEGHALMLRMCKPRGYAEDGTPLWWEEPQKLARLYAYCQNDVDAERAVQRALRRLTPHEREVYLLDQRLNDRGVQIDRELVVAAQRIVKTGVEQANAALDALTAGQVQKVSQSGRLVQWLQEQGIETDSVARPALATLLEGELEEHVRQVLQLRADAGRSSVAKLTSMLHCMGKDLRARGLVLYHGAGTGRWSGKLIQPQNFPRGEVKDVESLIPLVLAGRYDVLSLVAHPIVVVLSLLRSMLTAGAGPEFLAGDFSAIEARVLNWLAGEQEVLQSFRAYDAGDKSQDPYKRMAVRMGRAATVAEVDYGARQAGKAAELGCGFQMGGAKFVKAAWDVYQVRVTEEQAEYAVEAYRLSHPNVVDLWYETERACLSAVRKPGEVQLVAGGRVRIVCRGSYLYIILPSGRPLAYAAPCVITVTLKSKKTGEPYEKQQLEFSGVSSLTKHWERQRAYGGFLVENIVQAVARDLMADAMLRAEARGLLPVMTVHDEIVCEVPKENPMTPDTFCTIMTELPLWAAGCPVAAEAWRGFRYRK